MLSKKNATTITVGSGKFSAGYAFGIDWYDMMIEKWRVGCRSGRWARGNAHRQQKYNAKNKNHEHDFNFKH